MDEGSRPLGGQFRQPASTYTSEETMSRTTCKNPSQQDLPKYEAPRVMTHRELLISLHKKVDRNHDWTSRQFSEILHSLVVI